MISSNQPLIRRAVPADAAAMATIMSDPAVFSNLLQLPFSTEAIWRTRLEASNQPNPNDLQLIAELDGAVVGSAGLHPMPRLRRRHVAMMGISVMSSAQRLGVGRALMQSLCDYADDWAQILRIELTVFSDNMPAIALYESFGFRHEGTHRAYALRDGVYADVHSMARLHPAPPTISWPHSQAATA